MKDLEKGLFFVYLSIKNQKMKNLHPSEFAEYYVQYINNVQCLDIVEALENNLDEVIDLVQDEIPEEKYKYRYQPKKWSIQEIIQHLIDAERIFAYRALRIARFDQTPLAGFEEDDYVKVCNADHRSMEDLLQEFVLVRKSTIKLFESFTEEMLLHKGTASNNPISVRAIGYIIPGHCIHHQNVIKERYF